MGEVCVIVGLWCGWKLFVFNVEGLCLIIDCVKEMLFNWLMMDVVNVWCLDCFVGSGLFGFEVFFC